HIFSKIDTDSGDGHNESLWVNVYPMIARKLIRRISRGSPFHSVSDKSGSNVAGNNTKNIDVYV
ncbi:hypothetical protein, partial [Citrobacter portucalensis]